MTDSIFHGLAIGLSLLASTPPGQMVSTLDFGRSMAYLGRAGWDNENTLEIQGERHVTLLRDMELIDAERRLTRTGDQLRGELSLPVHMSLVDIAVQLNPGGAEAVRAAADAEFGAEVAAGPEPPAAPEVAEVAPAAQPEEEDNGYQTAVGLGAWKPSAAPEEQPPGPPVVPRPAQPAAEGYDTPTAITPGAPPPAPPEPGPPPARAPESASPVPPYAGAPGSPALTAPPGVAPSTPAAAPPPGVAPSTPAPPGTPGPASITPSAEAPPTPSATPPPAAESLAPPPHDVAAGSPGPASREPALRGGGGVVDAAGIRPAAQGAGLRRPAGVYANVAAALGTGRHLILTGAPGAGKTTLALAVARAAAQAGRARGATLLAVAPETGQAPLIEAARRGRWVVL